MKIEKKLPKRILTSQSRNLGAPVFSPKKSAEVTTKNSSKRMGADIFARIVSEESLVGLAAINSIRKGYSAQILKAASHFFNVPNARIQAIVQIPASTAARLEKSKSRINSAATERLYRMGMVTRMAIEIFENERAAIDWMCQPNHLLNDIAPLDLMDTEPGAVSVRQVLNAISTGSAA